MGLSRFQKLVDRSPAVSRLVRDSGVWNAVQRRKLRKWKQGGSPIPPPNIVKQAAVAEYAQRFGTRTLIETGTYYGSMLLAMRNRFDNLYSIELDDYLHARAGRFLGRYRNIHLLKGDSASRLPEVLADLKEPALFWLDAHYSGPGTAKGTLETPIAREMDLVLQHPVPGHVILIDDAHDFGVLPDYPTIEALGEFVRQRKPDWVYEVRDDIIRCHAPDPPPSPAPAPRAG